MICKHQFFQINTKQDHSKCDHGSWVRDGRAICMNYHRSGVVVMCALCAEQRVLWSDNNLEIIKV